MLLKGNCLETLKTLPDNSIDSIVTDPPYELGFMGKSWDDSGISYNVELWKECLRVLKPGGHLLSFGGSRTYHRMACAIEDAGFEIRDQIMWIYGSGFPKSKNVALSIDKGEGLPNRGRAIPTASKYQASDVEETNKLTSNPVEPYEARTELAKKWEGWGTALKPAHEPICVARKPLTGTVASNVLEWGTGALNIDGSRVGTELMVRKEGPGGIPSGNVNGSGGSLCWAGSGKKQPILPRLENVGRWPANVILSHAPDCEEVGTTSEITGGGAKGSSGFAVGYDSDGFVGKEITTTVWRCVEGCPTLDFPTTGPSKAANRGVQNSGRHGGIADGGRNAVEGTEGIGGYDDLGGSAARFFYTAKASKSERNAGLEGLPEQMLTGRDEGQDAMQVPYKPSSKVTANIHPTVKPLALMRYLVKMVTPTGGVVLDPFLGSGTTAVASILEGFLWVGCEMTEDYWPIIDARVDWAYKQALEAKQERLF